MHLIQLVFFFGFLYIIGAAIHETWGWNYLQPLGYIILAFWLACGVVAHGMNSGTYGSCPRCYRINTCLLGLLLITNMILGPLSIIGFFMSLQEHVNEHGEMPIRWRWRPTQVR